jgi:hypothetical protein
MEAIRRKMAFPRVKHQGLPQRLLLVGMNGTHQGRKDGQSIPLA